MDPAAAPNINILSFKNQDQSSLGRFLTWSLRYGRIIIIVTEFLVIAAFISRFYFDRRLVDLNDQIDNRVARITATQAFEKEFLAFQTNVNTIGGLLDTRKNFANLLTSIMQAKPATLSINDITIQDKSIIFICSVASPVAVNEFLSSLTQSGKFSDIAIDDISSKDAILLMSVSATLTSEAFK